MDASPFSCLAAFSFSLSLILFLILFTRAKYSLLKLFLYSGLWGSRILVKKRVRSCCPPIHKITFFCIQKQLTRSFSDIQKILKDLCISDKSSSYFFRIILQSQKSFFKHLVRNFLRNNFRMLDEIISAVFIRLTFNETFPISILTSVHE